jgi:hypothetical protein
MMQSHPERLCVLIVQNANAYQEGLGAKWSGIASYWTDRTILTHGRTSSPFCRGRANGEFTLNLCMTIEPMWLRTQLGRPGYVRISHQLS